MLFSSGKYTLMAITSGPHHSVGTVPRLGELLKVVVAVYYVYSADCNKAPVVKGINSLVLKTNSGRLWHPGHPFCASHA